MSDLLGKKFLQISTITALREAQSMKAVLDQFNICSADIGDGEIACACLKHVKDQGYEVKDLGLTSYQKTVPNILFFQENSPTGKLVENLYDLERLPEGSTYSNFKNLDWKKKYKADEKERFTHGELLAHSFACTVRNLFAYNESQINKEKETIILVGRPSALSWERLEKRYAELLGSKLALYLDEEAAKKIHILVMSESSAAMAGAVELKPSEWQSGLTIILDLGSSTFDMTVVMPEGIPKLGGEQSFFFGGNQVDKAIEGYGNYLFCQACPNTPLPERPGRVAQMRFKKELSYGPGGENLTKEIDSSEYKYTRVFHYPVDKENITAAISRKELMCEAIYEKQIKFSGSWLDTCKNVMQDFRKVAQEFNKDRKLPVRLILTGGVSNMPEVVGLAEQVFGVKAKLAPHPSHTVSRGMALILGNEIKKLRLLKELEAEIGGLLPNVKSLQERAAQISAEAFMQYVDRNMADWCKDAWCKSLNELLGMVGQKENPFASIIESCGDTIIQTWFRDNSMNQVIEGCLKKKFQDMFPDFKQTFDCSVETPKLCDIALTMPQLNFCYFFNEQQILAIGNAESEEQQRKQITQALSYERNVSEREQVLAVFHANRDKLRRGVITVNGLEMVGGKNSLPNAEQWFYRQFENTARQIRDRVQERLYPTVEKFVENLTYYLAVR